MYQMGNCADLVLKRYRVCFCLNSVFSSTSRFSCVDYSFQMVEKLDPIGTDFFWQVALESPNEDLAKESMSHILDISYLHLAPRLKKDPATLHKKFINDCYKRLEMQIPCSKTASSNTPSFSLAQLSSLPLEKR